MTVLVSLILSLCLHGTEARAAAPLFKAGASETFSVFDSKTKKSPQLTVLNDDSMQITISAVVAKALDFPSSDKGLTLKFEALTLTPFNDTKNITGAPNRLHLHARISGRDFELEPTLSKADFEKGHEIAVKFPKDTNDASVATITSSGTLVLKYDSKTDRLEIPHAEGSVAYESKLAGDGHRHLVFSGYGLRQAHAP